MPDESGETPRRPDWLKVKLSSGPNYRDVKNLLRMERLHTVCEEARCPNIFECFEHRTATFMILGNVCTWACRYCAVETGTPHGLDLGEPVRVAETVARLGLSHVVITSVTRDDLPDGGAWAFAACIEQIRKRLPRCSVEVLIPDLRRRRENLEIVMRARPDILNHNIETVPRLFRAMRPKGDYEGSLRLLAQAKEMAPEIPTKSGMMVGLGETFDEVLATMDDLRRVGVDILTIGQYLRPTSQARHVPAFRYWTPDEFRALREAGLARGFTHVEAGPLVRSSYHAWQQAEDYRKAREAATAGVAGPSRPGGADGATGAGGGSATG
ncbi:MAG: lipoyl synthase [Clostridia bacterium]|nr:lipoyl synthase [Clostridia bacterium]